MRRRVERCRERALALAHTLDIEAEYLAQRRLEGYGELLQRKDEQIQALEEAERRLRRALNAADLPAGREGVRMALRRAPAELDADWQALEQALYAIQARNEANGRMIYRNLEHARRVVDLIAGLHEHQDELTYGTNGSCSATQRSRKITEA
nr:flagellar protein FlgN [Halorhodospira abdelmalekii]